MSVQESKIKLPNGDNERVLYHEETSSKMEVVAHVNAAGDLINPATQETMLLVLEELQKISALLSSGTPPIVPTNNILTEDGDTITSEDGTTISPD